MDSNSLAEDGSPHGMPTAFATEDDAFRRQITNLLVGRAPWLGSTDRYTPKDPKQFTEFERRYPPDPFGEEATDNARIWKVYRDRAQAEDQDLLEGWNNTLNILLIFAGLFSAVATAFIIESYKDLKPDYAEITAKALIAALSTNSPLSEPLALGIIVEPFQPTSEALWINGLWFASLILSLGVTLLAILAKQWLDEYASTNRRPASSARYWAWRHVRHSEGMMKWGMTAFVSTLPVLMHAALFLFFTGLVLLLRRLSTVIANLALALIVTISTFYIASTLLPLWYPDCPTVTPLLRRLHDCWWWFKTLFIERRDVFRTTPFDERGQRPEDGPLLDMRVVRSMTKPSCGEVEIKVALDSIGSFDVMIPSYQNLRTPDLQLAVLSQLLAFAGRLDDPGAVARCARSALFLRPLADQIPEPERSQLWLVLSRMKAVATHDLFLVCDQLTARLQGDTNRLPEHSTSRLNAWGILNSIPGQPGVMHPTTLAALVASIDHWNVGELTSLLTVSHCDATYSSVALSIGDSARRLLHHIFFNSISSAVREANDPFLSLQLARTSQHHRLCPNDTSTHFLLLWILLHTYSDRFQLAIAHASILNPILWTSKDDGRPVDVGSLANPFAGVLRSSALMARFIHDLFSLDGSLQYFDAELLVRRDWDEGVLLGVLFVLGGALVQQESSQYWSSTIGKTLHNLLDHIDQRGNQAHYGFAGTIGYIIPGNACPSATEALYAFASFDEALENSQLNLLRPIPSVFSDRPALSAWALLQRAVQRPRGVDGLAQIASHLVVMLCALQRSGHDVHILFTELFPGNTLSELVRLTEKKNTAWTIAVHAREISRTVSPGWWDNFLANLTSNPTPWTLKGYNDVAASFVDDLNNQPEDCQACRTTFAFKGTWRNAASTWGITPKLSGLLSQANQMSSDPASGPTVMPNAQPWSMPPATTSQGASTTLTA